MSHQELLVFKQTYENTVQNSITVKIAGPTKKRSAKKVRVKWIATKPDTNDLCINEHEQENLIK